MTRVGRLHGVYALGDDKHRGIPQPGIQVVPDTEFRFRVYGTGTVVQYQYLGFTQQGPGDADALLLSAGKVDSTPSQQLCRIRQATSR